MKNLPLTTVAVGVLLASSALAQDDPQSLQNRQSAQSHAAKMQQFSEDNVGLTIWRPEHADPRRLLSYVKDLTETKITVYVQNPQSEHFEPRNRDRFIVIENSIGVQDFEEGRVRALDLLKELDASVGAMRAKGEASQSEPVEQRLTRVVRPRAIGADAAALLIQAMGYPVNIQVVQATGAMVLSGATEDVARAESLLRDVDVPVPQMTLHCSLVEASDEPQKAQGSITNLAQGGSGLRADGSTWTPGVGNDLGKALAGVMPGKHFREIGRVMVRGAAGGNAVLEVETSLAPDQLGRARFTMGVRAKGWDSERGVLSLDRCRFLLSRQVPSQTHVNQMDTQNEGITTDLALRAGETTVVGSLGGNPVFVVLRFEVQD